MRMDLRQLKTFVTVVEQGTVTKAALQLRIAQPALSRQISDLERELGLNLFDRIGRRLVVSAEGEQLLGQFRKLLDNVGAIADRAELLRGGDTGLLKVAASSLQIESSIATFLPLYKKRYPNVHVKLTESVGADTLAMLDRGEIQVCISLLDAVAGEARHFGIHQVSPLEVLAACHPSLRFEHGTTVDIGRLAPYPMLLMDTGFVARKTFDAVCRLAKVEPKILIESRAPHMLMALAEAGLGIAIVSSSLITYRYRLDIVRVAHKRKPIRDPLAVVWDKRRVLPRYARDFCDQLAQHMRNALPPSGVRRPGTKKQ